MVKETDVEREMDRQYARQERRQKRIPKGKGRTSERGIRIPGMEIIDNYRPMTTALGPRMTVSPIHCISTFFASLISDLFLSPCIVVQTGYCILKIDADRRQMKSEPGKKGMFAHGKSSNPSVIRALEGTKTISEVNHSIRPNTADDRPYTNIPVNFRTKSSSHPRV
jgi:hypothetical protein